MSLSDEQPSKQLDPTDVTDEGIVIFFNEVHPMNAYDSIELKCEDKITSVNEEQSLNVLDLIVDKEEMSILVNELQQLKEWVPTWVTEEGSVISDNDEQP